MGTLSNEEIVKKKKKGNCFPTIKGSTFKGANACFYNKPFFRRGWCAGKETESISLVKKFVLWKNKKTYHNYWLIIYSCRCIVAIYNGYNASKFL